MSKFKRIVSLLLGLSLAVGLLGAGLNAAFTNTGSVSQTITVGGVAITVSSSTPNAVVNADGTITCPAVAINYSTTPTGTDAGGCSFTIASAGAVAPSAIYVNMSSDVAGGPKFAEILSGDGFNGSKPLQALPASIMVANLSTLPATIGSHVSWTGLDGSDSGRIIVVTFAISAS